MADNVTLNAGAGGSVIATDDDGVAQHQYVKLEFGADNVQTKVDISNPLPVTTVGSVTANAGANLSTAALVLDTTVTARLGTLGQKAMAASTPVVLASDQSTLLVSGPLTDTQLRLTAVPVSTASLPLPTGAATETTLGTRLTESDFDTKTGSLTETAPVTDTASSGLNGRLQRVAQRLTSLLALLPSALVGGRLDTNIGAMGGAATSMNTGVRDAGTLRVTIATNDIVPVSATSLPLPTGASTETTLATMLTQSDFDTKTGILTEAAPATDTASSGVNGRLQRIAQRLTSLLAVLPAALVGGRLDMNTGTLGGVAITLNTGVRDTGTQRVTIATDDIVPISAAALPLPTGAATETTLATLALDATVTSRLTAGANPGDGISNAQSVSFLKSLGMMFNGTGWDRIRGTTAAGLTVNVSNASLPVTGTVAVTTDVTLSTIDAQNVARRIQEQQWLAAQATTLIQLSGNRGYEVR